MGRFQMWMTGDSDASRQMVMLVRGDKSMTVKDTQSFSGSSNVHDLRSDTIQLCGTQQADHFVGTGESNTGGKTHTKEIVEGVTTTIGDSKYLAMYIRPAGMQADGQAETALHSLCPKG